MKTSLQLLLGILFAASASAEFRVWTRADGKTAELDLVSVAGTGGAKSGQFTTRSGQTVTLPVSTMSAADALLLNGWTPSAAAAPTASATPAASAAGGPSVFDKLLDNNLERLSGKSLKSCKDATKPTKYYLFYYTASWCGPCHKFTPSLVEFYNKNKNAEFELVLITSDDDEKAMEEYAAEMKMPWPQLKLPKADKFKEDFPYPGTGIPNLVITDLQGKLIKGSYEDGKYIGPTVVMNHLGTLLKK
ncbi:MAG: thioredoxin-like domain-containing protein [Verrucomicrobiota bacterium]